MIKRLLTFVWAPVLAALALSCQKPEDAPVVPEPEPPVDTPSDTLDFVPDYVEPVADTIVFTTINAVYRGDETGGGMSDNWNIQMWTDMEIVPPGDLMGPGQLIQLTLNARLGDSADPHNLVGIYVAPQNTGDLSPGTYIPGSEQPLYLPDGLVYVPDWTYFGDVPEGTTEFEPDFLREGKVAITDNEDGTYTIRGVLVGTMFYKRFFKYTGEINPKDKSQQNEEEEESHPNSTLTEDFEFTTFDKVYVADKGDIFYSGISKLVSVNIAEPGIEYKWGIYSSPEGEGRSLRIDLLVAPDANIEEDGLPVGTYTMTERNEYAGVDSENLIPGNIVPGKQDDFKLYDGSWFRYTMPDRTVPEYARLVGGTVVIEAIEGVENGRKLTVSLQDCNESSPKTVSCVVELEGVNLR